MTVLEPPDNASDDVSADEPQAERPASTPFGWRGLVVVLVVAALGVAVLLVRDRGVSVRPPEQAGSQACALATSFLPDQVASADRRDTAPASPGTAAWGDPAVIARCGVAALGPTEDECLDVDGVDWVAQELSDGFRFTTYGRSPALELLVPRDYAPESLLLPAFGQAASSLPGNGRACQ